MRIRLVLAIALNLVSATLVSTSLADAQTCADIQQYDAITGAPNSPYDGQVVSVTGKVYVAAGTFGSQIHYLYQGTSGIRFDLTAVPPLAEGAAVGIGGTVTTVNGEIILSDATVEYSYASGVESSMESIAGVLTPFSRIGHFVAVTGEVCARTDSTFCLSDSGDTVQVWIASGSGITLAAVADGETYRVRGACSMFNGEIRLLPRRQTDLVEGSPVVRVQAGGDGSFATIAEGIEAAVVGDTVLVSCGTYNEHDLTLKGGVVIRSETGDPACVTVDAQQLGGVFNFWDTGSRDWFNLEGLTMTGASGSAGALQIFNDAKLFSEIDPPKIGTPVTIKDCVVSENSTTGYGSVVYALDQIPPIVFDNCVFANNNSASQLMRFESTLVSLRIVNCTMVNNAVPPANSLVWTGATASPNVAIENSLIVFNQAGIYDADGGVPPVFTCSNLYGNSQGDWLNDIAGQAGILGNFSADPHFCDQPGSDYSLATGSLCLPGNHPNGESCGVIGARGEGACGNVPTASDHLLVEALGGTAMRPGASVPIRFQILNAAGERALNEGLAPCFAAMPTMGTVTPLRQQPDSTWTADYTAGLIEGPDAIVGFDLEAVNGPIACLALQITNAAIITSVADVPNDQGRQVRVIWNADVRDTLGSADPIVQYVVWREVSECAKAEGRPVLDMAAAVALLDREQATGSELLVRVNKTLWEPVGPAVPGMMWSDYASVVPTLGDSTRTGVLYSRFFVSAHTPNPQVFFSSVPAVGYSVDNLAPAAPATVLAVYEGGETTVDWNDAPEADFDHFRIYRGGSADFVLSPENLKAETTASTWPDPNGGIAIFYKITAVDFAGNESPAGYPPYVSAVGDSPLSSRTALLGAAPNPFNPTTRMAFELAVPGQASLKIYDPAGRLVAVLVDGHREAGRQSVVWDGRDTAGRTAAAGVYLYRLEAGGFQQSGRVTMVK